MKKKIKIKHADEFEAMHRTSSLVLEDPGAAAAYAAQEAFSAGVTPSAVMYSSPDGAATGDHLVTSEGTSEPGVVEELANSAPEEPEAPEVVEATEEPEAASEEPEVVEEAEEAEVTEEGGEKAEAPKLDKAVKPALNKSVKDSAPAED